MALPIPEECEGCPAEGCVCRECAGDTDSPCVDLNDKVCVFEGKKSCLWYQENFGTEIV